MREFVYYSPGARTSGNWKDLKKAGRMDIVCNVIIQSLFVSNKLREGIHLHLVFEGQPNPPMHLELFSDSKLPISKKDVAGLIKRMLYKCNENKRKEIFPGCFIEKKSFHKVLDEAQNRGREVYILDKKGKKLRDMGDEELQNAIFVIGDHEGLPKKMVKRFKNKISLGNEVYFASQTFILIQYEFDIRGL